jgi:hypothetical protein
VSMATVVAVGVTTDGWRQVLGVDVGPSEDETFWLAFLRSLVRRGLKGVVLVISDAHAGLKRAIACPARGVVAAVPGPLHAGCFSSLTRAGRPGRLGSAPRRAMALLPAGPVGRAFVTKCRARLGER